MKNLEAFLKGDLRNAWLWDDERKMEIYVRKSFRVFENVVRQPVLDLANIDVKEEYKGQGVFTRYLEGSEALARSLGYQALYVEQIFEERLVPFLLRKGFNHVNGMYSTPSMYRMLKND